MGFVTLITGIASVVTIISIIPIYRARKEKVDAIKQEKADIYARCIEDLGDTKDLAEVLEFGPFIPVNAQQEGPHDNAENPLPSDNRYELVPRLLNEIFPPQGQSTKRLRYAILAGSGMGKSIFSASFCKDYIENKKYKNSQLPYAIRAVNLAGKSINDIEEVVKSISEPWKTILVLDSLDENQEANNEYLTFMQKLDTIIDKVKVVIITVRTQFYSKSQEEPKLGTKNQYAAENSTLKWNIHYISPFTQEEAYEYIKQKYSIGTAKYEKACALINKTTAVMGRPLVLSFIDDLLSIYGEISYVKIYHEIINKWLKREIYLCPSNERPIDTISNDDVRLLNLYNFTKQIAVVLSQKDGFSMDHDSYEGFLETLKLETPYSFQSRSLLNRTSRGDIKFAHKSFLEFFIAIDSLEHPERQYDAKKFDFAQTFSKEFYKLYLREEDKNKFKSRYHYVDIPESPFVLSHNDVLNQGFFDKWFKHTEEAKSEYKINVNRYYLYKYWKTLLFTTRRQPSYVWWELRLFSLQDYFSLPEPNLELDNIEDLKEVEFIESSQEKKSVFFGSRLCSCKDINTISAGELREKITNHKNIIFPSFESGAISDHELTFTIANGIVESKETVFRAIRKLCERKSEYLAVDIKYKFKKDNGESTIVREENVYPIVILLYKELSGTYEEVLNQQIQYIRELIEYVGDYITIGKEIIIHFISPNYSYYYLLDYNSVVYTDEEIVNYLSNLMFASCIQDLYDSLLD